MKNLIYLLLIIFASGRAFSQTGNSPQTPKTTDGPAIKFDSLFYDFGEVTEGAKVLHKFYFKNTGNKPLVLNDVGTSCGCTIPTWPKYPIQPGAKDYILVSFDSNGRGGTTVVKNITVTSNTGNDNIIILEIRGKVLKKQL